jgi:hypothetical protein
MACLLGSATPHGHGAATFSHFPAARHPQAFWSAASHKQTESIHLVNMITVRSKHTDMHEPTLAPASMARQLRRY